MGVAVVSTVLLLAAGLNCATASAAEPESCGSSAFCYAGYSAKGLKTIAEDLNANGQNSRFYNEMKAAMDADTRGTLKVASTAIADKGQIVDMPVRLIGILHDDKADGTGKAGLTFQTVNSLPAAYCMNGALPDADYNDYLFQCSQSKASRGGWRDTGLRTSLNSGEIWNSMPDSLKTTVEPVVKMTNNTKGNREGAMPSATADKLWLASTVELGGPFPTEASKPLGIPAMLSEGRQYEFFEIKGVTHKANTVIDGMWATSSGAKPAGSFDERAWTRTMDWFEANQASLVGSNGDPRDGSNYTTYRYAVAPAFCL